MVVRKLRISHGANLIAQMALTVLRGDRTIVQLTSQYGVHATLIYKWKMELQAGAERIFSEPGKGVAGEGTRQEEKEKNQLYEQIGRLMMELEWVKKKTQVKD